jgi:hypothetical protein
MTAKIMGMAQQRDQEARARSRHKSRGRQVAKWPSGRVAGRAQWARRSAARPACSPGPLARIMAAASASTAAAGHLHAFKLQSDCSND